MVIKTLPRQHFHLREVRCRCSPQLTTTTFPRVCPASTYLTASAALLREKVLSMTGTSWPCWYKEHKTFRSAVETGATSGRNCCRTNGDVALALNMSSTGPNHFPGTPPTTTS